MDFIRQTGGPNVYNQVQAGPIMGQAGPTTGYNQGQPPADFNPLYHR